MKRSLAVAVAATLALSACGRGEPANEAVQADSAPAPATSPAPAPATPADHPAEARTAVVPAAPGAPDFAPLYPGATITQPATVATAPDGSPGGIVTFTTRASPQDVIAFYRQHAEAAGLAQVAAMNQGEARAYGAAKADGGLLNVVADPVAEGETSVQLSWTSR